ncbi:Lambda family phage minor tail protein L [Vibrio chagasii]|nr:Lambda family phage minor tail protein L [Vibrio chagasii]CAH7170624.1 Lambda family phage minor tail protein L [Vibrio chagasii]CAK3750158.1 Phage minor tail protein L [Vibrio crassostreae]
MNTSDRYVGKIVALFELDFRRINGGVIYITNNSFPDRDIVWNGVAYTSNPILLEELSNSIQGTSPTPTCKVGNLTGILNEQFRLTRDLVGGKISRTLVFSENLDDGDNPSLTPIQPPESFYINNSLRDKTEVSFRTSTQLGAYHTQIPAMRATVDKYPGLKRVY